jgi:hypothetical protein
LLIPVFAVLCLSGCINPFAPKLNSKLGGSQGLISDQKNIQGVFQNFQYAYTFKDTLIYSKLLSPNFTFSYTDYDIGADVSWGREDEMKTTNGLFQNCQSLDLVWNEIVSITGDSTEVMRSFNLTVTFNPTNVIYVDGRVDLTLAKNPDNTWKILHWVDDSNY